MATKLIPTSVLEFNGLDIIKGSTGPHYLKPVEQAFDDIPVEKRLKREVSLPAGVENWNISNYDSYLNFDDNAIIISDLLNANVDDDRIVPEGDVRTRCPSGSSISSSNDDSGPAFHNFRIKTINTVCMDSGSTCISSNPSFNPKFPGFLDPEETYQNLNTFFQKVPECTVSSETLSSFQSLPSTSSDSPVELTVLQPYRPFRSKSPNDFMERSPLRKRHLDSCSEDEVFIMETTKMEFGGDMPSKYKDTRRKNNLASKHCRKTRKEKQKDMEERVNELEQERETLRVKVQVLQEMIQIHKSSLLSAFNPKNTMLSDLNVFESSEALKSSLNQE